MGNLFKSFFFPPISFLPFVFFLSLSLFLTQNTLNDELIETDIDRNEITIPEKSWKSRNYLRNLKNNLEPFESLSKK